MCVALVMIPVLSFATSPVERPSLPTAMGSSVTASIVNSPAVPFGMPGEIRYIIENSLQGLMHENLRYADNGGHGSFLIYDFYLCAVQ